MQKLKFEIGGYSNELQAKAEAREFANEGVFERRSALFPKPFDFRLKIKPLKAEVKKWPDPPSPLNQYYVELEVEAIGEEDKIKAWERRVLSSVNIFHASQTRKPGTMGERAEHLAAMAKKKEEEASEANEG